MNLQEILRRLSEGKISVEEAQSRLSLAGIAPVEDFAQLDVNRQARKGVPEVVFAPGKTADQLVEICASLLSTTGRAIVAGLKEEQWQMIEAKFSGDVSVASREAKTLVLREPGCEPKPTGGKIGLLAAGTADVPASEQARIIAEEMGCEVIKAYDVGVAGVHRLVQPLKNMMEAGVAVVVVAAGMEGALPSVVAGLVPVPVIGLPTSTGYGLEVAVSLPYCLCCRRAVPAWLW